MSESSDRRSRKKRANQLRADWRSGEVSQGAPGGGLTDEEEGERRDAALGANDLLRAEAPDDLETRRRGDQLEREIRRSARDRAGRQP